MAIIGLEAFDSMTKRWHQPEALAQHNERVCYPAPARYDDHGGGLNNPKKKKKSNPLFCNCKASVNLCTSVQGRVHCSKQRSFTNPTPQRMTQIPTDLMLGLGATEQPRLRRLPQISFFFFGSDPHRPHHQRPTHAETAVLDSRSHGHGTPA